MSRSDSERGCPHDFQYLFMDIHHFDSRVLDSRPRVHCARDKPIVVRERDQKNLKPRKGAKRNGMDLGCLYTLPCVASGNRHIHIPQMARKQCR